MQHPILKYKNREVVIRADGIVYKGVLKEITETAVTLKRMSGWVEVPIEKITSIRGKDEKSAFSETRFTDDSFYGSDNGDSDKKKG